MIDHMSEEYYDTMQKIMLEMELKTVKRLKKFKKESKKDKLF